MPTRDPQAILQRLGKTTLKVDTYFLQTTGFVANQTLLKLGEYNLNCVPATIGVDESRFLAVLTPVEVNHFARFKVGTHILILTFDDPENNDVARFPLRVSLIDLVPVPDRKNVCFLLVKLKSLPTEFVLFLGAFLEALEAKKAAWESLAAEATTVSAGAPSGFDGKAIVISGDEHATVTVSSFHTKKLTLVWPEAPSSWAGRGAVQVKMTPRGRIVTLEGTLDTEGNFLPEFHSEWLDYVEDLRFHKTLKGPGRAGA
jgi:hypothetical protein